MKAIWKFPALVRGVPPGQKDERLCLVAGETPFEIPERDIVSMPLAVEATYHYNENGEFRIFDGELYRSDDEDDALEVEAECADVMSVGRNAVYQTLSDEIVGIMKSGAFDVWPRDAFRNRQKGARDLTQSGVKLTEEGSTDLESWRARTVERLGDFIIAGGRAWVRTAEPVYLLEVQDDSVKVIVDTADLYRPGNDELGRPRSSTDGEAGSRFRVFSLTDRDLVVDTAREIAARLGVEAEMLDEVEVFVPEVLRSDIDRLEFDRVARVAVAHAEERFTRVKPGGGKSIFSVAPTSLVLAWTALRDQLESYDPLVGVPDGLESVFADFVAEADGFSSVYGPCLLSEATREAVGYAFSRWEDRRVDVNASPVSSNAAR